MRQYLVERNRPDLESGIMRPGDESFSIRRDAAAHDAFRVSSGEILHELIELVVPNLNVRALKHACCYDKALRKVIESVGV